MTDTSVWFQVSGKYRTVAKLPDGMTGVEALIGVKYREDSWAENMGEGHAGDHYLRCYGKEKKELSREDWVDFKSRGGTTYNMYAYDKSKTKAQKIVESMVRDCLVYPDKSASVVSLLLREYKGY
jgi:hypothetical protein